MLNANTDVTLAMDLLLLLRRGKWGSFPVRDDNGSVPSDSTAHG